MTARLRIVGALFVLLAACTAQLRDSDTTQVDRLSDFDSWVISAFLPGDVTEERILALGDSVIMEKLAFEPPGHAVGDWVARKYLLDGLQISAILEQGTGEVFLSQIVISDGKWLLSNGLGVGQSASEIRMPVDSESAGLHSYCGMTECIRFDVEEGYIAQIVIDRYWD